MELMRRAVVVGIGAMGLSFASVNSAAAQDEEDNKTIVRRWVEEIHNGTDPGAISAAIEDARVAVARAQAGRDRMYRRTEAAAQPNPPEATDGDP